VHVDLRVISTTNRALSEMVREGKFSADLYYRLNVIALRLPPLRERGEDIRELAEHFARLYSPQGKSLRLSAEFLERLETHVWPGNARETGKLRAPRRGVSHRHGNRTRRPGRFGVGSGEAAARGDAGGDQLRTIAWAAIGWATIAAMISCGRGVAGKHGAQAARNDGSKPRGATARRAAELLGVSLRTVRNKIRCYGAAQLEQLCA